jgi:hypothetical protein
MEQNSTFKYIKNYITNIYTIIMGDIKSRLLLDSETFSGANYSAIWCDSDRQVSASLSAFKTVTISLLKK